jgi:lipopolysaccharide transport system ATP-binding protein
MCSEVHRSMRNTNTVIHAHRLEKRYRLYATPTDRLIASIGPGKRKPPEEVVALKPLSFQIRKGETVGIVGRNGSGKSTLLQLICGTLQPSGGSVEVRGRIGALLELGSGFNPDFTGLENIFLNGAILGLSQQEIEQRLQTILNFADIGNFVERPVRTYSSGMALRLAFAVQACIDPEILVIDEALAVGDETFQKKCFNRLSELKEKGTSILFVTHSCPSIVQHCDRALLLDRGCARWLGDPETTTTLYQRLTSSNENTWSNNYAALGLKLSRARKQLSKNEAANQDNKRESEAKSEYFDKELKPETTQVYPSRGIRIESIECLSENNEPINCIPARQSFQLRFNYFADIQVSSVRMTCHIANPQGIRVTALAYPSLNGYHKDVPGQSSFSVTYKIAGHLQPGTYFVGGGISSENHQGLLHRVVDMIALRILDTKNRYSFGLCDLASTAPILTTT